MSGHYTFTIGPQITPKPANGYTYGPADGNGCAATWAHTEMAAQLAVFGAAGHHQAQYVAFYRSSKFDGQALDQVDGLQKLDTLTADQAKALSAGTTNTRFINVSSKGNEQSLPALNAAGSPVTGACAWQGPNAQGVANVNLDNLLTAYAHEFQHNLNKGADGS